MERRVTRGSYCQRCDKWFKSERALQQHRETSRNHGQYVCQECSEQFDDEEEIDDHFECEHRGQYICSECSEQFDYEEEVEDHYDNEHAYVDFECDQCEYTFYNRKLLEDHLEEEHPLFACESCGKRCKTANCLKRHKESHHPNFSCSQCGAGFFDQHALRQHAQVHSKPVACHFKSVCTAMFPSHAAMIAHLETGKCPSKVTRQQIDKFVRKKDVNHIITKPLITYAQQDSGVTHIATMDSWNAQQNRFPCYLCDKDFYLLQHLNAHLRSSVHRQKEYKCPGKECRKEFKVLSSLVQHIEGGTCGFAVAFVRKCMEGFSVNATRLIEAPKSPDVDKLSFYVGAVTLSDSSIRQLRRELREDGRGRITRVHA